MTTIANVIDKIDAFTAIVVPAAPVDPLNDERRVVPAFIIGENLVEIEIWAAETTEALPPPARCWHVQLKIRGKLAQFNESGVWQDYTMGADTLEGVRSKFATWGADLKTIGNAVVSATA